MAPKVSIIMPVKNVEPYIQDCIESIRKQTYQNWELHIVNDHSKDDTQNILDNYTRIDPRIKSYLNQGSGIISALDLALKNSEGEFITRFDGDDLMPDERLEAMVKALAASPPKTIVTGKVKYFSDAPISKGYQTYEDWINERIDLEDHWNWIYRECVIASPNWMVRTDELKTIAPFSRSNYPEDYDLVLQWYHHGFKVKGLKTTTLLWREHSNRTSRNSSHYNQEHFFRLKLKHFIENELDTHSLVLWGTDVKGKLTARLLDEMNIPFQWMGLKTNNRQIKGHQILHYTEIESMTDFRLLLTIYPSPAELVQMENYFRQQQLLLGVNYWYL